MTPGTSKHRKTQTKTWESSPLPSRALGTLVVGGTCHGSCGDGWSKVLFAGRQGSFNTKKMDGVLPPFDIVEYC